MVHDSTDVLCTAGNQSSGLPLFPFHPSHYPPAIFEASIFPSQAVFLPHFPSIPLLPFPFRSFPFPSIPPVFSHSDCFPPTAPLLYSPPLYLPPSIHFPSSPSPCFSLSVHLFSPHSLFSIPSCFLFPLSYFLHIIRAQAGLAF